ncbi:HAMP domain-containing protein [Sphingomonas faeni]|uniref:HAMP domain-containing protein n=1 Tax=Sphingomonas faeni TaxID=185950 RepID=UPI0033573E49
MAAARGNDPRTDPLPLTGPPEVGEAASAFNLMRERLNRYVEDRTPLIAAVAHDLRTPSTRLPLRLEDAADDIRVSSEADIKDMRARIGSAMASSAT